MVFCDSNRKFIWALLAIRYGFYNQSDDIDPISKNFRVYQPIWKQIQCQTMVNKAKDAYHDSKYRDLLTCSGIATSQHND